MAASRRLNENVPPVVDSPEEIDHDGSIALYRYHCPRPDCPQRVEQIPSHAEWMGQATAAEQEAAARQYHDWRVHGIGVKEAVSRKRVL